MTRPAGKAPVAGSGRTIVSGVCRAVGVTALLLLAGCSFVIANGPVPAVFDPASLRLGAARSEIEQTLGVPIASEQDMDGAHINTYSFRGWRPPSNERGLTNLALDIMTLGFWELIGTPNELILDPSRRTRQITLTFDANDRLVTIVPPVSETARP